MLATKKFLARNKTKIITYVIVIVNLMFNINFN